MIKGFCKEKNIEQDGKLETQAAILKRIDDNVKKLLDRMYETN